MANGDLAQGQGLAPVLPTDDIRMGYDRINAAADLVVKRGMPLFNTKQLLDAYAGAPYGQLATADRTTYRWNGQKWCPWTSAWADYVCATEQLNLAGGPLVTSYRWDSGRVRVRMRGQMAAGGSFGGGVTASVPEPISYAFFGPNSPVLEGRLVVRDPASGRLYYGSLQQVGDKASKVALMVQQVNATWEYATTFAEGQPVAAATNLAFWVDLAYESDNYPLSA